MASTRSRAIENIVELVPDRLYFSSYDDNIRLKADTQTTFLNIDNEIHYESFYTDFGPLNLSVLYRFCKKLHGKLKLSKKRLVLYTTWNAQKRVNGAFLIGAYSIVYCGMSANEIWSRLQSVQPPKFVPYRDAAMGPSTYDLLLSDVFSGVEKAVQNKWLDFSSFDPDEYEFYERVENGDLNWIIPDKIISFCGPHAKSCIENGYPYHAPEVYFDYFRRHNVTTIIRLNKKMYDAKRFIEAGFAHVDLFFIDGSTPSEGIVRRFIAEVDRAKGAVAVHCKAGLGRTGTLIGCWMMKQFGVTAAECMAWTRICRPASVIGPQQQFLLQKQNWFWSLGGKGPVQNGLAVGKVEVRERRGADKDEAGTSVCNGNVSHLTSKVDDIKLNNSQKRMAVDRPISLSRRGRRSHESPLLNGNDSLQSQTDGESQGDRLLHIKAVRQHQLQPAQFSSPTTPVKPLMPAPTSSRPHHLRRITFTDTLPATKVARVTVTSRGRGSAIPVPVSAVSLGRRSLSNKLISNQRNSHNLRQSPYPVVSCSGQSTKAPVTSHGKSYHLRWRQGYSQSVLPHINNCAAKLPPNTALPLGPRKNVSHQ